MNGEDFYITLPSNSSKSFFSDNTISNYRTKLPRPIRLSAPYEVALCEVHFPTSWSQIRESDCVIWERYTDSTGTVRDTKISIPAGRYPTLEALTAQISANFRTNTAGGLVDARKHVLSYDPVTNRVKVFVARPTQLKFKGRLAQILGFPKDVFVSIERVTYAPRQADIMAGLYSLFVYTDIIQHQAVGHSNVQLLRLIHIDDTDKKFITTVYDRPQYLRVAKGHFDTIEIALKTDQNEYFDFAYGKVIIVLHFRPIKYN